MKPKHSKSTLFLMELMIAIFFFAITSAICARIFVKAHLVSSSTTDLNNALSQAESLAEVYRAYDGDMVQIAGCFPDGTLNSDSTFILFYDRNWQICSDRDAALFQIELTPKPAAGHCINARILVQQLDSQTDIYALNIKKFVKGL